jgi:hypothetical protein
MQAISTKSLIVSRRPPSHPPARLRWLAYADTLKMPKNIIPSFFYRAPRNDVSAQPCFPIASLQTITISFTPPIRLRRLIGQYVTSIGTQEWGGRKSVSTAFIVNPFSRRGPTPAEATNGKYFPAPSASAGLAAGSRRDARQDEINSRLFCPIARSPVSLPRPQPINCSESISRRSRPGWVAKAGLF